MGRTSRHVGGMISKSKVHLVFGLAWIQKLQEMEITSWKVCANELSTNCVVKYQETNE